MCSTVLFLYYVELCSPNFVSIQSCSVISSMSNMNNAASSFSCHITDMSLSPVGVAVNFIYSTFDPCLFKYTLFLDKKRLEHARNHAMCSIFLYTLLHYHNTLINHCFLGGILYRIKWWQKKAIKSTDIKWTDSSLPFGRRNLKC